MPTMLYGAFLLFLTGPAPVTIYVGPIVRDGFADADKGALDTVTDLQRAISKDERFRLVAKAKDAQIQLLVIDRGISSEGTMTINVPGSTTYYPGQTFTFPNGGTVTTPGSAVTMPGVTIPVPINKPHVTALLRVGTYDRPLVASGGNWSGCAKQLAKDVAAWLEANRDRLGN